MNFICKNTCKNVSINKKSSYQASYYESCQMMQFFERSTEARTVLNGCQLTAVTAVVWSLRMVASCPELCHTYTDPSADPAAIAAPSMLKATRLQSHPTLKLSSLNDLSTWFVRMSSSLMVSSRTQHSKYLQSLDRSREVTLPPRTISLAEKLALVSQKRIFLSKWPLIMVVPVPSVATRSLQLLPQNLVSIQAPVRSSQIFSVRSWLPVTTFVASARNLPAITFPLCPVRVCWNGNIVCLEHGFLDPKLRARLGWEMGLSSHFLFLVGINRVMQIKSYSCKAP